MCWPVFYHWSIYTDWKQKTTGSLMFSQSKERHQWHEMGSYLKKYFLKQILTCRRFIIFLISKINLKEYITRTYHFYHYRYVQICLRISSTYPIILLDVLCDIRSLSSWFAIRHSRTWAASYLKMKVTTEDSKYFQHILL